ncbi:MAG: glycosyltransferase family 4 protein [Alphaproteobacteria bacterium]
MTTAIHYTSINLANAGKEIFGLQVAISSWIKSYFRYSQQEKFNFLVGDAKDWDEVKIMAAEAKLDPSRLVALDRRYARENFGHFDTIFRPDPHVQNILWQRQQVSGAAFNFCGLAHAIGGLETGDLLERYCLTPSDENDAIVCPSHAVRSAISAFWDNYSAYLQQRFGTYFKCPVQLPIIPLGIDIERYEAISTPAKRSDQRQKLGFKDDDIVLLWVGRLSHAIKAHPLPMFQAAERAAEKTGATVHLVMVGYFVPDDAGPMFQALAADICKKAKVHFIANNDPRFPEGLWAAGDIFLSLIDNMQESFGLTPIEAMAAGLPRVISDWDGYRDSVTDGEDGFLIRTTQPPPGNGRALSELLLSGKEMYGGFLAKSALSVAVDYEMATEAIIKLIQDKNKRKSMAEKAHKRVRPTYSWQSIIPAYEALWKEMSNKRKAKPHQKVWPSALPQVPDPYTMYLSYPTAPLLETTKLTVMASTDEIKSLWKHEINIFGLDMMITPDEATKLINYVSGQTNCTISNILQQFKSNDRASLWRTVAWLLKLGILKAA